MITRKRKRKPTAAEELDAAIDALPRRGEPRPFDLNNLADPHERLERALKKSQAGIMKAGPKSFADSKTQRNIASKYTSIIAELEPQRGLLGLPYTRERRETMVSAMRASKAYRQMNKWTRPTGVAFIKHLQRHYKPK